MLQVVTERESSTRPAASGKFAVICFALLNLALVGGCGSSTGTTDAGPVDSGPAPVVDSGPPPYCVGGFVRKHDGGASTCEGRCAPSLCKNSNNACVDNSCVLICSSLLDCGTDQECLPAAEDGTGAAITTCQYKKTIVGTPCPNGDECQSLMACGDGSPCPDAGSCSVGSCLPLTCLGAGGGDETAYCTRPDCHADGDCPGGYWCAARRDAHAICGQAAPPRACGSTNAPCVNLPTAGETTYAAGALCTERNFCLQRRQCGPCATDLDCSLVPGQKCVQGACLAGCLTDVDCVNGFSCTSGTCAPRAGSCAAPTGQGLVCSPCRIDAECGAGLLCGAPLLGGLRSCLLATSISCATDAECPVSASGARVTCLNGSCQVGPINQGSNALSCWPSPAGAACITGADCNSGNCVGSVPNFLIAGQCK